MMNDEEAWDDAKGAFEKKKKNIGIICEKKVTEEQKPMRKND